MSQKVITYDQTADYSSGTLTDVVIANDKVTLDSVSGVSPVLALDSVASGITVETPRTRGMVILGDYAYGGRGARIWKVKLSDMSKIADVAFTGTYAGFIDITTDGTYLYAISTNGSGGISDQDFVWKFDTDLNLIGSKVQFYTAHNHWGGLQACKYIGDKLWIIGGSNLYLWEINTNLTWHNESSFVYNIGWNVPMRVDGEYCFIPVLYRIVKVLISDPSQQIASPIISAANTNVTDLIKVGTKFICRLMRTVDTCSIRWFDPSNMTFSLTQTVTPYPDYTNYSNTTSPRMNVDGNRLFVGWATDYLDSKLLEYDLTTDPVTYVGFLQLGVRPSYLLAERGIFQIEKYGDYLIVSYFCDNTPPTLRKILINSNVNEYSASGTFEDSINIHIDASTVSDSNIHFVNTLPANTDCLIYAKVNIADEWTLISDNDIIPDILGINIATDPTTVYWKAVLSTTNTAVTPELNFIEFTIDGITLRIAVGFVVKPDQYNQSFWRINSTGSEISTPCVEMEANGKMAYQIVAKANKITTATLTVFIPATMTSSMINTPRIDLYDEAMIETRALVATGNWQDVIYVLEPTVDTIYKLEIVTGSNIPDIFVKIDSLTVVEA